MDLCISKELKFNLMSDDLNFATFNVCGICDSMKRRKVFNFYMTIILILFSYRKHIVPKLWRNIGGLNGVAKYISHMDPLQLVDVQSSLVDLLTLIS